MKKELTKLEKDLKIKFKNEDLLQQAFVHRSYLNEHPDFKLGHNERLEFLGDAVLELVVTEYLFKRFPGDQEGKLTNLRASMVNTQMLAHLSEELGLQNFLFLSRGEEKDQNKKARESILANTFESLVGATYLDQGIIVVKKFLEKIFDEKIPHIYENLLYVDPKSRFQELSQEKYSVTPHYRVIEEEGPDHDKTFTVGVYVDKDLIAKGKGGSKQIAQVDAAKKGLKKKKWQ
jgi:ribonuclease III